VLLESRELRERFGAEYAEYCRRVPRYLPRVGRRSADLCPAVTAVRWLCLGPGRDRGCACLRVSCEAPQTPTGPKGVTIDASLITAVTISLLAGTATAQPADRCCCRRPTINKTHIVFVYAGDLWSVQRQGVPRSGSPLRPAWRPARSSRRTVPSGVHGEYDGNVDVFVIPASGGLRND